MTPKERYEVDPDFHYMVNWLRDHMTAHEYWLPDLRDACEMVGEFRKNLEPNIFSTDANQAPASRTKQETCDHGEPSES